MRNLDVMRAFAVLLVFFGHLAQAFGYLVPARIGVLMFFVHTALVLLMSLERDSRIGVFYFRRAMRIYPLSLLVIALTLMLRIPATPSAAYAAPSAVSAASSTLLIQNITRTPEILNVLWSLPWEVQMYLALPAVFLFLTSARKVLAAMAACAALRLIGEAVGVRGLTLLEYEPCFLAGALAYRLCCRLAIRATGWWPIFLIVTTTVFIPLLWLAELRSHWALASTSYLFCFILGAAIPRFPDMRPSFVTAAAERIARYSYGLYLFHPPIFWLCFYRLHMPVALSVPLALALSVVVPVAVYRAVEKPLIDSARALSHVISRSDTTWRPLSRSRV